MKKSRLWKGLLPVIVILVSCGALVLMLKLRPQVKPEAPEKDALIAEVELLEKGEFTFKIKSQGTVNPAKSIQLIAEVDGRAMFVHPDFKAGGAFEKGQVLVELDSRDYQFAVTRAEAQVAAAKVRVATVEAEAEVALEDWKASGRSGQATPLLLRQPQLLEAKASLAASEAELAKARLDLERTRILAPFAGRVRSAAVDEGQFVRRGVELASVFGVDRVEVVLPLSVGELAFLDREVSRAEGTNAIRVDLIEKFDRREDTVWEGKIVRVSGDVDVNSRQTYVVAAVEQPYRIDETKSQPLRVGTFVEATIHGRTVKGVYQVPRVLLRENDEILVVDLEDRLQIRSLEVIWVDQSTVVARGGIEPGDALCLSAVDIPLPGRSVQRLEATEEVVQ
jgi:RND family efflux transporter MFP subunit